MSKVAFVIGLLALALTAWVFCTELWPHLNTAISIATAMRDSTGDAGVIAAQRELFASLVENARPVAERLRDPGLAIFLMMFLRAPAGEPGIVESTSWLAGVLCTIGGLIALYRISPIPESAADAAGVALTYAGGLVALMAALPCMVVWGICAAIVYLPFERKEQRGRAR